MTEDTQQYTEPTGGSQTRFEAVERPGQQLDQRVASTTPQHNAVPLQSASAQSEFCALDPRVIKLWRVTNLIGWGVILIVSLAGATIFALRNPEVMPWIFFTWPALFGLCGWLIYWRPRRLYRSWGYRVDDRVLETRSGLLFQVTRLLPLARVQHVDLQRGPLERTFGLSSLILHTAGTHEATTIIPGLEAGEAVRLRDHLVAVGGDDAV
ncbi:MAG: PH domain-containing protein [Pyrinomonadaceae bacterium]|nr:PH domain-containing protein [Pyrinomonadaceae bacterium]